MGTTRGPRGGPPSAFLACACAQARGLGAVCPTPRQEAQVVPGPRWHGRRGPHAQAGGPRHGAGWSAHAPTPPAAWTPSGPPSVRHGIPQALGAARGQGSGTACAPGRGGPLGTAPCLRHPRATRWPSRRGARPDGNMPPTPWGADPAAPNAAGRHRASTPLRRRPAERAADGLPCLHLGPRRSCRVGTPHPARPLAHPGRGAGVRWRRPRDVHRAWQQRRAARTGSPAPSQTSGPVRRQVPSARTGCQTVWPSATARVPPHCTPGSIPPHGAPSRPPGFSSRAQPLTPRVRRWK